MMVSSRHCTVRSLSTAIRVGRWPPPVGRPRRCGAIRHTGSFLVEQAGTEPSDQLRQVEQSIAAGWDGSEPNGPDTAMDAEQNGPRVVLVSGEGGSARARSSRRSSQPVFLRTCR